MKKAILNLSVTLLLLTYFSISANAQRPSDGSNAVVTSAVPFLRISPDARSAGMGDIGVATDPDANSGFWNLGKTAFATDDYAIGATYTPWLSELNLKDVYLVSLGGYYKLDEKQAINLDFKYFSLGNIQFTNFNGDNLNLYRPREFALGVGYSRKLGLKSGLGIGIKYINSDLASNGSINGTTYRKGSSVAGDLHYYNKGTNAKGNGFNWGVTLSNLGAKVGYTNDDTQKDFIPATLSIGGLYTKVFDSENKLGIGLDLSKLLVPNPPPVGDAEAITKYQNQGVVNSWFTSFGDAPSGTSDLKEITAGIGAEYTYKDLFMFRAGYFYEHPDAGSRKYFTVGAGLKYNTLGLNFAYIVPSGSGTNTSPLSNTLRFSLLIAGKK